MKLSDTSVYMRISLQMHWLDYCMSVYILGLTGSSTYCISPGTVLYASLEKSLIDTTVLISSRQHHLQHNGPVGPFAAA